MYRLKAIHKFHNFEQSFKLLFKKIQDKPTQARITTEINTAIKTHDFKPFEPKTTTHSNNIKHTPRNTYFFV